MPDNKDPLGTTLYGKTNWPRTKRSDILKQYPGLEYVSGEWGNDKYKYKLPSGEYAYYGITKTGEDLDPYQFGPISSPVVAKAPSVKATAAPVEQVVKQPTIINPISNEPQKQSINFASPYGYSDPNTGKAYSYDAAYKEKEIAPDVQSYRYGGLIKKVRGYEDGGKILTPEEQAAEDAKKAELTQAGIGLASQLGGMGGQFMGSKAMNEDGTVDVGLATGGGALKGGAKGLALGANPALMAATGGLSAPIGAVAGALVGGGVGYFGSKNANEKIDIAKDKAAQDKLAAAATEKYQSNMNKALLERQQGFKDGGEIKGKGGPKDDKISAKVKAGSFVVPAENKAAAKQVKKMIAPSKKKEVANLDQEDGTEVKLSDGEFLFSPEEKEEIINELGEHFLEALAPNAEHESEEMREGGLTPSKAKKMLKDGTANGQPLTEKQRGYFGLIASGYKCGGMVKKMATGGNVEFAEDNESGMNGFAEGGEVDIDPEKELKKLEDAKKEVVAKRENVAEYNKKIENYKKRIANQKTAKSEYERMSNGVKLLEKQYADLENRASKGIIGDSQERIDADKVVLLNKIKGLTADRDRAKKEYDYNSDSKNFDYKTGLAKESSKANVATEAAADKVLSKDKAIDPNKIYSNTGAGIEKALGTGSSKPAKSRVAIPQGNNLNVGLMKKLGPQIDETMSVEAEAPLNLANNKLNQGAIDTGKVDLTEQVKVDGGPRFTDAQKRDALTKGLGIAGTQLQGLGNYFLPFQQYKMGQKFLAESGERPKGQIDPDFQRTINNAQANAQFGYTPEEQALLDSKNINALRAGQNAAKNYAGGSAGNAFSMTRQAAGDYYSRGLQAAIGNKQLKMDKQAYADELQKSKAAMNRNLFLDNLNAWQQEQQAGGNLVGAGLQNLIGSQRYNQEMQFNRELAANSNPYAQYRTNPING